MILSGGAAGPTGPADCREAVTRAGLPLLPLGAALTLTAAAAGALTGARMAGGMLDVSATWLGWPASACYARPCWVAAWPGSAPLGVW
jgi:hypothetical protein